MDHQTQISLSILNESDSLALNSESENELDKSPNIVYRTPQRLPNKRSRTKRDLLPYLCQEKRFSQTPREDLANEIPRWMERARGEER